MFFRSHGIFVETVKEVHRNRHQHPEKAKGEVPPLKLRSNMILILIRVLALEPENRAIQWGSMPWEVRVRRRKIILTHVTSWTRNTAKMTFQ